MPRATANTSQNETTPSTTTESEHEVIEFTDHGSEATPETSEAADPDNGKGEDAKVSEDAPESRGDTSVAIPSNESWRIRSLPAGQRYHYVAPEIETR